VPLRTPQTRSIPITRLRAGKTIPVPMIKQEQTQWCWAGCADMGLDYYGNAGIRQCDLANWAFGLSGCCSTPSSSLCNQGLPDAKISQLWTAYGIQNSYTASSVPFATLQSENNANRPVEVAYSWNGGGGHVAIVRGWDQNATGPFLLVNDPAYGSGGVYYSNLLTAYGLGVWDATWTGLRR